MLWKLCITLVLEDQQTLIKCLIITSFLFSRYMFTGLIFAGLIAAVNIWLVFLFIPDFSSFNIRIRDLEGKLDISCRRRSFAR